MASNDVWLDALCDGTRGVLRNVEQIRKDTWYSTDQVLLAMISVAMNTRPTMILPNEPSKECLDVNLLGKAK